MQNPSVLYDHLVEVARAGHTTTYHDISLLLGLDPDDQHDRDMLVRILLEIACNENAQGRPMLSVVVVQPEIGYPGKSFFLLARELGTNNCCDDRSFFSYELRRVHAYWQFKPVARREVAYSAVQYL